MPERASKRRPARMATTWSLGARYLPAVCACAGGIANTAIAAIAATSTPQRFHGSFMRASVGSQSDRSLRQAFYRKFTATEQHRGHRGTEHAEKKGLAVLQVVRCPRQKATQAVLVGGKLFSATA